jgi:hypothetical protein
LALFHDHRAELLEALDRSLVDAPQFAQSIAPVIDHPDTGPLLRQAAGFLRRVPGAEQGQVLAQLWNLALGPSVLVLDHGLEAAARLLSPEAPSWAPALVDLVRAPGVADNVFNIISGVLTPETAACGSDLDWQGGVRPLLTARLAPQGSHPAVLADRLGNPQVATDPQTGTLRLPFIDGDGDGAADTDGEGTPIGTQGQPLRIRPFAYAPVGRDAWGRAYAADGAPLFAYIDVEASALHAIMQWGAEHIARGSHTQWTWLATADPTALYRLGFALLEDLRYPQLAKLLGSWAWLIDNRPQAAEHLLAATGEIYGVLRAHGLTLLDRAFLDLFIDAMPLLSDLFAASVPSLLLDVLHQLSTEAPSWPERLSWQLRYTQLHKEDACSDAAPDFGRSSEVRYDLPAAPDNYSGMEQLVTLLTALDCGEVPFSDGKSVAWVVIEQLADRSPESVCDLIDALSGPLGLGVSETVGTAALSWMGCDGASAWAQLQSLQRLADSGLLDALLPMANAFVARGETRTLLDLAQLIDAALSADGAVRQLQPALADALDAGVAAPLFTVVAHLVTAPALDGAGRFGDVVVDSFAFLTDDSALVRTTGGWRSGTSHGVEILQAIAQLLEGDPVALQATLDTLTALLDGVGGRLQDRRVVPVMGALVDGAARAFAADDAVRGCFFDAQQERLRAFVLGENFPPLQRLLAALLQPGGAEAALTVALPEPASAQVAAALVQRLGDPHHHPALLRFLAEEAAHADPTWLLAVLAAIGPGADRALLALTEGPLDRRPIQVFLHIAKELAMRHGPGCAQPFDARALEQWLTGAATFLEQTVPTLLTVFAQHAP